MESHSQARQDAFVFHMLKLSSLSSEKGGTYLEIGAGDPIVGNNSYFFEKNFNWKGVSIDINETFIEKFKEVRKNTFICCDVTTCDWTNMNLDLPPLIDYLSFDVDEATPLAFKNFPFDSYEFKVMTIEHDRYRFGDDTRNMMRRELSKRGYQLICNDVRINGGMFEDWWVNPKYVDMDRAYECFCRGLEYSQILVV